MRGGKVCDRHGGLAPQVRAAAAARQMEDQARRLIGDSFEPLADPIRTLLERASEAEAFRAAVVGLVNNLRSLETWSEATGSQIRAEVMLYERALDRVARLCIEIVKLGLEERLVRVRESEARALAEALDYALGVADLSAEQAQTVKRETAARLRSVA